METISTKALQILEASKLGLLAFENGIKKIPCLDAKLLAMKPFKNKPNEVPKGEASSVDVMKAWINGWEKASK